MERRSPVAIVVAALALLGATPFLGSVASAGTCNASSPEVEGPVSGGLRGDFPHGSSFFDLAPYGYMEEEYFVSGTARSYPAGSPGAFYKTRILVFRPADPADFNGSVVIEWENTTGQTPASVVWYNAHPYLLREGYAYVSLSAQQAGTCCSPLTLQGRDPVRYGSLSHPGDDYSYDILSQTAQALLCPEVGALDPLGNLRDGVRRIVATGVSQSAGRLASYANLVRDVDVLDGLHVQSGGAVNAQTGDLAQSGPVKDYPSDLDYPIIEVAGEGEMSPSDPTGPARYRLWEVAGADHLTAWNAAAVSHLNSRSNGNPPLTQEEHEQFMDEAGEYGEDREKQRAGCSQAGAFPLRYAYHAALHHLDQWIRDPGHVPPVTPRVAFDALGKPARDEFGNVVGGYRLPPIDWPVATYTGDQCGTNGNTEPFCDAQIQELYPFHEVYEQRMQAATDAAVESAILLPEDAEDLMFRARRSTIGTQQEDDCLEQPDFDQDGFLNLVDNCPVHANPTQEDGDGDGRGDACDNCLYVGNTDQLDRGGIDSTTPDGIGDACQCGDVSGNGIVTGQDGNAIRRASFGLEPNPLFAMQGNCDVTGNGLCNGQDGNAVRRVALGLETPGFGQNCPNALPAP